MATASRARADNRQRLQPLWGWLFVYPRSRVTTNAHETLAFSATAEIHDCRAC